jgi:hypothetical protein
MTTTGQQPGIGSQSQPEYSPPRRHRSDRKTLLAAGATVGALFVGVAVGHSVTTVRTVARPTVTRTVPGPTVTQTVQVQARPQPVVTKTVYKTGSPGQVGTTIVARFNGSGTQNTGQFTVPDSWHLSWSYWGCPFAPANFQVTEYSSDGSMDFNGVSVNELGSGRGPVATYAYGDGGTHYFSINTEGCSWSLAVVTG